MNIDIIQLYDFCWVLLFFSLFVEILPLFIHFSTDFGEHFYNHYFELFTR